jgi:hypothetical protein
MTLPVSILMDGKPSYWLDLVRLRNDPLAAMRRASSAAFQLTPPLYALKYELAFRKV